MWRRWKIERVLEVLGALLGVLRRSSGATEVVGWIKVSVEHRVEAEAVG